MSNEPSAPSTPRQPFSLRELFCLTTLSGLVIALVLNSEWTNHERWLLGLTLGCSLLGIVLARACQRRSWLLGIVAGVIGGLIAVWIIGQEWLRILAAQAAGGSFTATELAELRNDYLVAGAVTVGLAMLLALLGVVCFLLLVWAIDAGEHGLIAAARRRPYRAVAVAAAASALVLGVANIDFLLAPQAWAPRHFIPMTRLERPMVSNHGLSTVRTGHLSGNGDWLLVESYMPGLGREVTEKEMYRLDPRPHVVPFTKEPKRASFGAFDCTGNRLVFLEWLGESYNDKPAETHRLRIVDLDRHTSETIPEKPRDSNIQSLQWLSDSALVIHYGDDWNGREGHTKLQQREDGKWTRHDSDVVTAFFPRSGTALEFRESGMRVVDLASSREIASFSQEWIKEMTENLGGKPSAYFNVSPDARFLMAGSKLYDRESQTIRNWRVSDRFLMPFFHGFTPRGQAVLDGNPNLRVWHSLSFLYDVPFGHRLWSWLMRERIQLIDPATGLVVARTRPLPESASSIKLSYDGSRMAVFTDDGVYVYDVPAKFR